MRKKNLIILLLFFSSCIATKLKYAPFKGEYPPTPYIITSELPKEKVWDKIIDFFAQNGLSIKVIDRSSGLIVSDRSKLDWSYEDVKGNIKNPNAWVVVQRVTSPMNSPAPILPIYVYGDWNIRIKENETGGTLINVNLVNIKSQDLATDLYASSKSTGVFEKTISDQIK